MSNSQLVDYIKISPHKTRNRTHKIDTLSVHCVVGQCSVETLGNIFSGTRAVSSNYGIGVDGRIGMYVEEADRSYCTSNAGNDHRAITIECACDPTAPYAVNQEVYDSLIILCADICERNGITKLLWKGDKNLIGQIDKQNMTVHRWFANKSCPGEYLYSRHGKIADDVNDLMHDKKNPVLYRVQTGAFRNKSNAMMMLNKLKSLGFPTYAIRSGDFYKIQIGAYADVANANAMAASLKAANFATYITTIGGTPA